MDKRDFSNLEDEIKDTVKNAFNAIDFARIKKDINDKADNTISDVKIKVKSKSDETINGVKIKIKNKSQEFNEKIGTEIQRKYADIAKAAKRDKSKQSKYICKRPVGSISGIVYTALGFLSTGVFGILLVACSVWSSFSGASAGLAVLFAFFAASIGVSLKGTNIRKRVKRFKQYASLLEKHNYCSINELAEEVGKKNKYVVKDLKKMVELDMFREAHIDDEKTYFMLSDEVYDDYRKSQLALKQREEEAARRQEILNEEVNDEEKRELMATIDMGRDYISQIKSVNDSLSGEEITVKLQRLQGIMSQIFNYIEKNPKKLSEVDKFTKHYLPITLKLINSYKELHEQSVQGENIKTAKNEIEKSIDIINVAFEKLLDDLFEEVALDISTDISVLETLFTQEGLTKDDFKK